MNALKALIAILMIPLFLITEKGLAPSMATAQVSLNEIAGQVTMEVTLQLKNMVELPHEVVKLTDIAQCESLVDVCREAYAIEVAQFQEEDTLTIDKSQLEQLLLKEWSHLQINLQGPESILVKKKKYRFHEAQIKDLLQQAFQKHNTPTRHWEVQKLIFPKSYDFIAAEGNLTCPTAIEPNRVLDLSCTFTTPENKTETVAFKVRLQSKQKAYQTNRYIGKQQNLTLKDLAPVFVSSNQGNQYLVDLNMLQQYQTKRELLPGTILRWNDVERPILIKRGDIVTLIYHKEALTLKSKVKALGSAAQDETISVVQMHTKKVLKVQVIDPETVQFLR